MSRLGPRLALAALAVSATTACAVPTNDEPVELSGSVPFGLVDSTTSTTAPSPEGVTKEVVVYLLETDDGSSRLVPVPRRVELDAGIQEILGNLFSQRPSDDRPDEVGRSTAIPESATLLSAARSSEQPELLIVDVQGLFGSIQGEALRNALAQIVWTATVPGTGVTAVLFRNDGEKVQALVDDLESTEAAVRRADYSEVS